MDTCGVTLARRQTPYVSVSMTREVRAALQDAVLLLSAQVGRKLTLSDIARADRAVAMRHPDELLEELSKSAPDETQEGETR
ncbi:hypothetical protein [Longimycelium tulufanense]|nr:hypothetical protein [Longimycelium tulufanense]